MVSARRTYCTLLYVAGTQGMQVAAVITSLLLAAPTHCFILQISSQNIRVSRSNWSQFRNAVTHDWLADAKLTDSQLKNVHEYLDSKGKHVTRGPASVKHPDGRTIEVLRGEEVEIINGIVYRTFLQAFPPINEAALKAQGNAILDIRWNSNWEEEGFVLEVCGVTGQECLEYTQRFCAAMGCKQKGEMVIKPSYFEVPIQTTERSIQTLKQVKAGATSIEF